MFWKVEIYLIYKTSTDTKTYINEQKQMTFVMRHMSHIISHMSHTMCLVSCIMCHVSCVMCCMLLFTCQLSLVTCDNSHRHSNTPFPCQLSHYANKTPNTRNISKLKKKYWNHKKKVGGMSILMIYSPRKRVFCHGTNTHTPNIQTSQLQNRNSQEGYFMKNIFWNKELYS